MSTRAVPEIAVVVPAYNRETTLAATLDSLLAQTHGGWRAMVIDDGSLDGTAALAEQYAGRDERIRVHRQANGGVSRARNAGIELAQSPWLFFLDADDWIVPSAFERLTAAVAADPRADAAYGGYVRVDEQGREVQSQLPDPREDLFRVFARTCAISIHACLIRSDLVRRVGGFDETLVTCEDWDLWQRVARIGARFTAIPDYIAHYRMRVGSASGSGRRMLADGLRVIERGHGEDPRLPGQGPPDGRALSRAARDLARTYYVCYAAGLEIAAGNDARAMIDELGEGISGDVDPSGVAKTLFFSISVGRATDAREWATFPDAVHTHCQQFVEALGERLGDHWFTYGARNAFERLLLADPRDERPRRAGRWYLVDLDLDGPPPLDLQLPTGIERVLASMRYGERRIGDVEVPVFDGRLPARVLADAVVVPFGWDIMQAYLERHVHPSLRIEFAAGSAQVARGTRVLYDGPLDPERHPQQGLHDRIGWTLLLQELWEERTWTGDDFYAGGRRQTASATGPHRSVGSERIVVDLAAPLPELRPRGRRQIEVVVTVAGAPLTVVHFAARRGAISADALRRAILMQSGYELCRTVVREAIVLAPADARGSLRERLARALAVAMPLHATVVGRAERVGGARWSVVPQDAAGDRIALAALDGDPVSPPASPAGDHLTLSAPSAKDGATGPLLSDPALLRSIACDRLFVTPDPWQHASSYEQSKYEQTLALLPARAERVLELGCAEGVFTERLAEHAGTLIAADLSGLALSRARRRCGELPNVTFVQLDAFESPLGGPYDLIVCSELLYYADDRRALARVAAALAAALAPGGQLVAAHAHAVVDDPDAPGYDWDVPFGAVTIERALLDTGLFALKREIRTAPYRVQRYVRRSGRRWLPRVCMPAARTTAEEGALAPALAERFLPAGGRVRPEPPAHAASTEHVPILMYHRVAPEGNAATQRWRVHPDAFEAQLRHLRDSGRHVLTLDQWRAACERRQQVPAGSVLITFDDGYADFPTYALPLLERYGMRATMFVVSDLVGATNRWDSEYGEELGLMGWDTLAQVQRRGIELGSHSSQHHALVTLSAADLARDLCRSRTHFREQIGVSVRSVCYPFGLHDAGVLAVAGACGFDLGVTTNEWHASFADDLLGLPRVEVRGTDTLAEFAAKLTE